jgi:hypothetical protein
MICGAQFRNELIEIVHLNHLFPKQKKHHQQQQQQRISRPEDSNNNSRKQSTLALPLRHILTSTSTHHRQRKKNISQDPSMDSLYISGHNKDDISLTEIEQQSDETSQCLCKLTTV